MSASVGGPPKLSPSTYRLTDQGRVTQARNEQAQNVEQIQKDIAAESREGDMVLSHMKDDYDRQYLTESSREELALENQKSKGYEELRDLKRRQQAELNRVRRDGEAELSKVSNHYRDSVHSTQLKTEEELRDLELKQYQQAEFERHKGADIVDDIKSKQKNEIDTIRSEHELRLYQAQKQAQDEYNKERENIDTAAAHNTENLDTRYHTRLADHEHALAQADKYATQQIQEVRADTSRRLAAYSERQGDPFYQLVDSRADFYDAGDHYVLRARIPSHEQKGVSVAVHGNQLVLQGMRWNEEKLDLGPGRSQSTNSYQSYKDAFPIPEAVDPKRMTREMDGEMLTVKIPKMDPMRAFQPNQTLKKVARAQVERPHFPANLPHVGDAPLPPTIPPKPDPKSPGSGTLT